MSLLTVALLPGVIISVVAITVRLLVQRAVSVYMTCWLWKSSVLSLIVSPRVCRRAGLHPPKSTLLGAMLSGYRSVKCLPKCVRCYLRTAGPIV